MINQMDLITAIQNELIRQGVKDVNTRQYNSMIAAADLVCDQMGKTHQPATENMGLVEWLRSDDTGDSSLFMAYTMCDAPYVKSAHPHDPADFHRCVQFLRAVPSAKGNIHKMKETSEVWGNLVEHWDELESLFNEEYPTGEAPKLYERMKELGC